MSNKAFLKKNDGYQEVILIENNLDNFTICWKVQSSYHMKMVTRSNLIFNGTVRYLYFIRLFEKFKYSGILPDQFDKNKLIQASKHQASKQSNIYADLNSLVRLFWNILPCFLAFCMVLFFTISVVNLNSDLSKVGKLNKYFNFINSLFIIKLKESSNLQCPNIKKQTTGM